MNTRGDFPQSNGTAAQNHDSSSIHFPMQLLGVSRSVAWHGAKILSSWVFATDFTVKIFRLTRWRLCHQRSESPPQFLSHISSRFALEMTDIMCKHWYFNDVQFKCSCTTRRMNRSRRYRDFLLFASCSSKDLATLFRTTSTNYFITTDRFWRIALMMNYIFAGTRHSAIATIPHFTP